MNSRFTWQRIAELVFMLQEGKLREEDLKELAPIIFSLMEQLPETQKKSAKLAFLIEQVRHVSSVNEVEDILKEGMVLHLVRTLSNQELAEATQKSRRKNLLVYLKGNVWGPVDWENKAQQALVIECRKALGRLKRDRALFNL